MKSILNTILLFAVTSMANPVISGEELNLYTCEREARNAARHEFGQKNEKESIKFLDSWFVASFGSGSDEIITTKVIVQGENTYKTYIVGTEVGIKPNCEVIEVKLEGAYSVQSEDCSSTAKEEVAEKEAINFAKEKGVTVQSSEVVKTIDFGDFTTVSVEIESSDDVSTTYIVTVSNSTCSVEGIEEENSVGTF